MSAADRLDASFILSGRDKIEELERERLFVANCLLVLMICNILVLFCVAFSPLML